MKKERLYPKLRVCPFCGKPLSRNAWGKASHFKACARRKGAG